jgi:hypothetical protein
METASVAFPGSVRCGSGPGIVPGPDPEWMSRPLQKGGIMFRRIALVAAAAAASMLSVASVASAAPVTRAVSDTSCPSGWFTITNAEGQGSITGNGVNEPVTLSTTGNCFEIAYNGTFSIWTTHEYQNGDGHCLWNDGGSIQLGAACKANHPNEEFYGEAYVGGSWTIENVGENTGAYMACEGVYVDMVLSGGCGGWNFP